LEKIARFLKIIAKEKRDQQLLFDEATCHFGDETHDALLLHRHNSQSV
jgi:hypothetical protein